MTPVEAVTRYVEQQPDVRRYCVAYSGGLDSHVLLLLMQQVQQRDPAIQLRAIHVNHGLQSQSAAWVEHTQAICDALEVPLHVQQAHITDKGDGPEASARAARYAQFIEVLTKGEHLLLAQHAEDQAETFLLQALRGSGPDGLSGIPGKRRFGSGYMVRPLLNCSQEAIREYAVEHGLSWIEDPSNQDERYDRNFLRLNVMPLLKERWPSATQTLLRASQRSAAASQTLLEVAQKDLDNVRTPEPTQLQIDALQQLPRERAFTALRLFVREHELRMPRLQDLIQVMSNLVEARSDSSGLVNVRDYVFRRYKNHLYLLPPFEETAPFSYDWVAPYNPLIITETGMVLSSEACRNAGIRLPQDGSIVVKSRVGGELMKLGDPAYHKAVKKILQESSIPPWIRESIPLLYIDDRLAAIWNVAVSVDFRLSSLSSSSVQGESWVG